VNSSVGRMSTAASRIFDLDGTLSDPAVGIGRSINFALESYGYAPIADGEVSQFIGPPLDQTFMSIVGTSDAEHIRQLVSKYRERYAAIGYKENVVYPGIPDVLRTLTDSGVPLGLCTSKRANFAEDILDLFGIRQYFRFVNGGDIGIKKTDQLASLLRQGLITKSAAMIGDRAVDILAAKENGLRSVGVLWGHGSLAELQGAAPDILLESPQELLEPHAA
jgi:phosphoglycolate phosphatase